MEEDFKLVVSILNVKGNHSLFLVDSTKSSEFLPSVFGGDAVTPRFSFDGNKIAFAEFDGSDFEIITYDLNTMKLDRITDNDFDDLMPSWSLSGNRIAWQQSPVSVKHPKRNLKEANRIEVVVFDLVLGELVAKTSNERMDAYPIFSSEDERIYFESGKVNGYFGIFSMEKNGNEKRIVYEPDRSANGIPDYANGVIAFERSESLEQGFFPVIVREQGPLNVIKVTKRAVHANVTPRLSPDAKFLAWHGRNDKKENMKIYVTSINSKGSKPNDSVIEIAVNGRSLFLPRWDSKGKLIAAEDRIHKTIVVFDMHRKHIVLNLPGKVRTQRFLEIWNFDIF